MNSNPKIRTQPTPLAVTAACPACGGEDLERFFEISELPTNCIALGKSREAALNCTRGSISLGFCRNCGAISNVAFDPSRLSYDPSYDNSLHFSPTFQKYADELAQSLVRRHNLKNKNIIDVGCGNAEFLSMICEMGDNRGTGFDPSFIPGRANPEAGQGLTIIPDYYSEKYSNYAADFVMCRHVLEHISEPRSFLRGLRTALAGKPDAAIFFEIPNADFVFKNSGMWDIIYEHCFYYTSGSLARLFAACGFDVQRISEAFGGQYLCLEAKVSMKAIGDLGGTGGDLDFMRQQVLNFAEEYRLSRKYWSETLRGFAVREKRVVLWGAGAKGAMFLNAFGAAGSVDYIVDVNPHKHGLFIPGTGQKVIGPEFLKEYRPDTLLIVNPNYHEEISRQVRDLGIAPDLLSI